MTTTRKNPPRLHIVRKELDDWMKRLDLIQHEPPGTWKTKNLPGRSVKDLDLDEIEVFCYMAYGHYLQATRKHHANERVRFAQLGIVGGRVVEK